MNRCVRTTNDRTIKALGKYSLHDISYDIDWLKSEKKTEKNQKRNNAF